MPLVLQRVTLRTNSSFSSAEGNWVEENWGFFKWKWVADFMLFTTAFVQLVTIGLPFVFAATIRHVQPALLRLVPTSIWQNKPFCKSSVCSCINYSDIKSSDGSSWPCKRLSVRWDDDQYCDRSLYGIFLWAGCWEPVRALFQHFNFKGIIIKTLDWNHRSFNTPAYWKYWQPHASAPASMKFVQ